ncbi:MAG: response regulator transcription factor, partial [Bacilli bacterium]|nr:response regulator transcription factor [Bacilli bacterium]
IRESNPKVAIVFLTKSTHFAIEGYKVNAIDYIVKPIVYEEFLLKMHKILDIMAHSLDREIIMKTVDGIIKTKESNILYVEVIRHYLHFHTKEGNTLVVRGSMKDYSEELSSIFARSGNSFIVNLRYVEKITKADIFLSGKDGELISVPLTRSFRESFLNAFSTYSGT